MDPKVFSNANGKVRMEEEEDRPTVSEESENDRVLFKVKKATTTELSEKKKATTTGQVSENLSSCDKSATERLN